MQVARAALAFLLLVGLNKGTQAENSAAASSSALSRLRADILSSLSATQTLAGYCAQLHLADPPVIRAARDRSLERKATPGVRRLLQVRAGETVRYRRVRLSCGARILSDADNWYVPARLTAEMNRRLEQTDTPFGTVVKPLHFHRRTLATQALHDGPHVLQVRALLVQQDGLPFSLVQENYSAILVRLR